MYLKYSEAACVVQEGCTANDIKKKSAELKKQIFIRKNEGQ
jgi:hypothetical protein